MHSSFRRLMATASLALIAAACSGDSSSPTDPTRGESDLRLDGITMTLTDPDRSSFSARGVPNLEAEGEWKNFAAALTYDYSNEIELIGLQVNGDFGTAVSFLLPDTVVASYPIGYDCWTSENIDEECAYGIYMKDFPTWNVDLATTYVIASGTVNVEKVTNEGIEGTFSGAAYETDIETGEMTSHGAIEIRNGRFSVPFVTAPEDVYTTQIPISTRAFTR